VVAVFGAKIMLTNRIADLTSQPRSQRLPGADSHRQPSEQPPKDKTQHAQDVAAEDEQQTTMHALNPVRECSGSMELVDQQ